MEDILASIKRIIADDGLAAAVAGTPAADAPAPFKPLHLVADAAGEAEGVLELTQAVEPQEATAPTPPTTARIVSPDAAEASRQALAALSAMVVQPEQGQDNTLDGLVRAMLRPMLKEWLDQNLPEIVQGLVEREIARISGRSL